MHRQTVPNFVFLRDGTRPTLESLMMKAAAEFKRHEHEICVQEGLEKLVFTETDSHHIARCAERIMGSEERYEPGVCSESYYIPPSDEVLHCFVFITVCDTRYIDTLLQKTCCRDEFFFIDAITKHNMYYFLSPMKNAWMSAAVRFTIYRTKLNWKNDFSCSFLKHTLQR